MTKKAKNRTITVVALTFSVVATVLSIKLLTDDSFLSTDPGDSVLTPEQVTEPGTEVYDGLIPVVESKYLWEYGWQQIASDKPKEIPTTKKDETVSLTAERAEPSTYYEVVTNWRGEPVTDEDGKAVTEIRTVPQTVKHVEYITDENGEKLTGADGKPVTEVRTEVVTTKAPPVAVTDENGEKMTDEDGKVVTQATTVARTTAYVTNTTAIGAKYWAQGVTDGETYVRMKIYLDGEYNISRSSVMTLTLRESSGLVSIPNTLTYNLSKGTCSVSPTKKYNEMAYVSHSGGKTVVTLIIPESSRPLSKNTTTFRASSTLSTFTDSDGNHIDEFTVSVL